MLASRYGGVGMYQGQGCVRKPPSLRPRRSRRVPGGPPLGSTRVPLARWVTTGGDDHDLYCIPTATSEPRPGARGEAPACKGGTVGGRGRTHQAAGPLLYFAAVFLFRRAPRRAVHSCSKFLPVDARHVGFVVAFAGGGREGVQPVELARGQGDEVGRGVLLDPGDAAGAGDRGDVGGRGSAARRDAVCAGVAPFSAPIALTSSTMARLRVKLSPVKRGLVLRQSSSAKSSTVRI